MTEPIKRQRGEDSSTMSVNDAAQPTEHAHELRSYGKTSVWTRTASPAITIIASVRDDLGIEAGDEYHLTGDPEAHVVTFSETPDPPDSYSIEPLPGELDLGTRTVRDGGKGSLYVTLPADTLGVLGIEVDEAVEIRASTAGWFRLRPW